MHRNRKCLTVKVCLRSSCRWKLVVGVSSIHNRYHTITNEMIVVHAGGVEGCILNTYGYCKCVI